MMSKILQIRRCVLYSKLNNNDDVLKVVFERTSCSFFALYKEIVVFLTNSNKSFKLLSTLLKNNNFKLDHTKDLLVIVELQGTSESLITKDGYKNIPYQNSRDFDIRFNYRIGYDTFRMKSLKSHNLIKDFVEFADKKANVQFTEYGLLYRKPIFSMRFDKIVIKFKKVER